ncbi:Sterol-4-alpha-carboxylate 3-dehydrogenase, decarboxylating [Yarrowia sp. C11]|nr:Sterol-4-alpha-carboxylate 3-dehydrogenase, decarboxylating [Yarrowia sp. E02]KAG5365357.1 Sterol-4-alpha-carboxylate 3-dehydrogenase, decarboxylating [Yarrowia sp. C11]
MNTVLIVGGSGFLGQHLIQKFHELSPRPEIHVFDIRPVQPVSQTFFSYDTDKDIVFHQGDLTNRDDVLRAIDAAKPDAIVTCASPVHGLGKAIYEKVNVQGNKVLLEAARLRFDESKGKIGRAFIYTSSASAVSDGSPLINADETFPVLDDHKDDYADTKAVAEKMILAANDPESGFLTVALRPAGIFGPGDRQMIPGFLDAAATGKQNFQLGNDDNLFDYTYVGNVAYSHVLAAEKLLDPKHAANVAGEAFFITNGTPIYFWAMPRMIWKKSGYEVDLAKRTKLATPVALFLSSIVAGVCKPFGIVPNFSPFKVRICSSPRYYDISKARKYLGYEPQLDLPQAVDVTLKWINETKEKK